VSRLLHDRSAARRMAEHAQRAVRRDRSWSAVAARTVETYARAAGPDASWRRSWTTRAGMPTATP
jgi:hypothetical protein